MRGINVTPLAYLPRFMRGIQEFQSDAEIPLALFDRAAKALGKINQNTYGMYAWFRYNYHASGYIYRTSNPSI